MKYWRGYLIAAILAAITIALTRFAAAHSALIDMVYPYATRLIISYLADWSGSVRACIWQVLAFLAVAGVIAGTVFIIIRRRNPIAPIGWLLACISVIFMLHTAIYSVNRYAGPLSDDVRLTVTEYAVSELVDATDHFLLEANTLSEQMERDSRGRLVYSDFNTLAGQAGEGFRVLTYEENYPVFAGSTVPVKKLGWSGIYSLFGVSGVTVAITGEAAVNTKVPTINLPLTMCEQMTRRMSIVHEQDVCFAAFLACEYNPSAQFRYSANVMALRYCYEALSAMPTSAAQAAVARIDAAMTEQLKTDFDAYRMYCEPSSDNGASVTDLLVSWYIRQYVLPQFMPGEQDGFDPFDETQVDLSGIVNAK